jgi:hypothetical protein
MASTVINGPGTPGLRRSAPTNLGSLTVATQVVQFSVMIPNAAPNGNDLLTIVTVGGTGATGPGLEASLDGGTTWFGIVAGSQAATLNATTLNADTAVTTAASFNISGIQGALFRAGLTALTSGTAVIWALLG